MRLQAYQEVANLPSCDATAPKKPNPGQVQIASRGLRGFQWLWGLPNTHTALDLAQYPSKGTPYRHGHWANFGCRGGQGKGASFDAFFADREASMAFWYLGDIISISHHRNITSSQHRIIPASPNLNVTYGEDLKWCENMHITSYHDRKLQLMYCMCKERAPGIQHSCGIHVQSIMRSLCICRWSMRRTSKTQIHRFLHEAGYFFCWRAS